MGNHVDQSSPVAAAMLEPFLEDEKVVALTLAVLHYGMTNNNPKATPPATGKVLEAADVFYNWLVNQ